MTTTRTPQPAPTQPAATRRLGTGSSTQGALALDLYPRLDPPRPPTPRRGAAVLPLEGSRDARVRSDAEAWAHRFAQAAVEVAGGDRPVTQLLRWTSRTVFQDLERRAQLVARARLHGTADQASGRRHAGVRPQVLGVRGCVVSPTVVELSAHVRHGHRSRAVALRLELDRGRWRCTALEFA